MAEGPTQLFIAGVTLIVADIAIVVVLVEVKLGTFPLPLAVNPIVELLFAHVYVAPIGVLVKGAVNTLTPEHTVKLAGTITIGGGFTVML